MQNICLINGSLRGRKAASNEFLEDVNRRIPDNEFNKVFITLKARVKDDYPEDTLKSLAGADVIILAFPLYTYGLPGSLMRLLEEYYYYLKTGKDYNRDSRVYAIVNCAFPRPTETTGEALRVMQNFCRRLSINWRFAVCIGTGPVVALTKKVLFLYSNFIFSYTEIASDILNPGKERKSNFYIKPVIPESIIAAFKRYYEKKGQMR